MKKIAVILVLYTSSFSRTTAPPESLKAALTVRCVYSSLPVYLDSAQIGATPLENYSISTGDHVLLVPSPYGMAWNTPGYTHAFNAGAGQTCEFEAVFTKTLILNSLPYGADILLEGRVLGKTPLAVQPMGAVRIEKEGYEPQEINLDALAGPSLTITLKPQQAWLQACRQNQAQHQKEVKWRRALMYGSMAVAAAAGYAAVHFHSKGNDAYADYMATASPVEMEQYLSRSHEFDHYAGVSYALFEIGFVLTAYFFLSSRQ